MSAHLDHIIDEALALIPQERSAVAWARAIRRRKDELRSEATKAVPWAEARARLNAL